MPNDDDDAVFIEDIRGQTSGLFQSTEGEESQNLSRVDVVIHEVNGQMP